MAANVVADRARAELLIRAVEPPEVVDARVRDALGAHVALVGTAKAYAPVAFHVPKRARDGAGVVAFGTDAPHMPRWGRPVLFGPGSILDAHTDHERVERRALDAAVEELVVLARELLAEEPTSLSGAGLSGDALLDALERGEQRVAEPDGAGGWRVHAWVKEELLAIFRADPVIATGLEAAWTAGADARAPFRDKARLPVRWFGADEGVRVVPGGSAVRRGAHLAPGVVCMPPMYVNVGAHVGAGTMIDSHALIGSCAQVGAHVHVSAAAQIGGVLEPPGARPVIVEDEAFVGGNSGLYEGVLVRTRAVIAAGVVLTATTPVFDLIHERELRGTRVDPLEIPAGAVVIPGTRPAGGTFARTHDLHLACALIVKYRDARTDAATELERALR